MYGYIYKTTNSINGKIYIGQHKSKIFNLTYLGSGKLIREAIKKYNKYNFSCELLEWCTDSEDADIKEIYWIKKHKLPNLEVGYNILTGGQQAYFRQKTDSELSDCIKKGLQKSSKKNRRLPTTLNRVYVHKDTFNRCIEPKEFDVYIEQGWLPGKVFIEKPIAWNRNKSKSEDVRILAISKARKEKFKEQPVIGCCGLYGIDNKNYKSDEFIINNYINNGFKDIWIQYGNNFTQRYFHISYSVYYRCLDFLNLQESYEHKISAKKNLKNKDINTLINNLKDKYK